MQTIYKKYGKFTDTLAAIYISQVIHGLVYLHEQGVVHRDIKGGNILTTKDGTVKLADFGISTTTGESDPSAATATAVGSPYWSKLQMMIPVTYSNFNFLSTVAPEIIELNGVSPVSDIWSVGCTVLELIQGFPPYGDLKPMQALYRMVQDEHPPFPNNISTVIITV